MNLGITDLQHSKASYGQPYVGQAAPMKMPDRSTYRQPRPQYQRDVPLIYEQINKVVASDIMKSSKKAEITSFIDFVSQHNKSKYEVTPGSS